MDKLGRKRDDHGHVIGNDEQDGQKCQHEPSAQAVDDEVYNREMAKAQNENVDMSETFDEDYEEEFEDRAEKIGMDIKEYFNDSQLNELKKYCDRYDVDFDKAKMELARRFDKIQKDGGLQQIDAADAALEGLTDDIVMGDLDTDIEMEKTGAIPHEPIEMPKYHWENGHIVIDEGEHKGESYDNEEDYYNSIRKDSYKSKYEPEDFEDARFYPTKSTMDGHRWVGRYRGIAEAHGLDRYNNYKGFNEKFKHIGDYNGAAMYQLPDGYYSINPNITSMSFKTKEALQNYLDKKNPEEHKYGVYWDNDIQRTYKGKGDDGKEYDMEGPDAYKAARAKKSEPSNDYNIANSVKAKEIKNILSGMTHMSKEEKKQFLMNLLDEE